MESECKLSKSSFINTAKSPTVGFDNVSVSRYSYPSITTIEQDKPLMGKTAAEILLDLISNKNEYNKDMHVTLPVSLVERETT